jgi:hypothetical protein
MAPLSWGSRVVLRALDTAPLAVESAAVAEPPRRFPPPWRVDKIPGGYIVRDANGQAPACVYSRENEAEGAAGEGSDQRRGPADRRQHRAAAGAAREAWARLKKSTTPPRGASARSDIATG